MWWGVWKFRCPNPPPCPLSNLGALHTRHKHGMLCVYKRNASNMRDMRASHTHTINCKINMFHVCVTCIHSVVCRVSCVVFCSYMSCHIVCRVSCVVFCSVLFCSDMSCHVMSCHVMSCHVVCVHVHKYKYIHIQSPMNISLYINTLWK